MSLLERSWELVSRIGRRLDRDRGERELPVDPLAS